jgi:hypothetical protein
MKFNMQQTVTRLAVAVCIQTIIAILLHAPVLAAPSIPVTSEINMVIAASKKQSKPVIDSVQRPQATPEIDTDNKPEQTIVPLTKMQKAQMQAIDAQLRFWKLQEKANVKKAGEANQLSQAIKQNVMRLWIEKLTIEEATKKTK